MSLRVLVSGGAGLIGFALCRHLVAISCRVVNVDALTYAADLSSLTSVATDPHYTCCHQDICDVEAMKAIFVKFQPRVVMHLAAESRIDRSILGARLLSRLTSSVRSPC